MLNLVRAYVPESAAPMSHIAREMPEEVMEELPNGLREFLTDHPKHFAVFSLNGVLHAKQYPDRVPLPLKKLIIPEFVVSVADCAEVWKTNEEVAKARVESLGPYANLLPLQRNGYTTELFVRPSVVKPIECGRANGSFASYKVQLYDVCRLARCLTTYSFTPWAELHEKAQPLLSRPLTQVVMSAPERFSHNADGVKFVLDSETLSMGDASHYTEEQLNGMLREVMQAKKPNREKKRTIGKMLFMKRNPFGSPLMEADVLAHYVYDKLPTSGGVKASEIKRRVFREQGEVFPSRYSKFFTMFPNLFAVEFLSGQDSIIYRADVAPQLRDASKMTDEMLAQTVITCGPTAWPREDPLSTAVWSAALPVDVWREICARHGTAKVFVKKMSQYFEYLDDVTLHQGDLVEVSERDCTYFYAGKLRDSLHEEYVARKSVQREKAAEGKKRSKTA